MNIDEAIAYAERVNAAREKSMKLYCLTQPGHMPSLLSDCCTILAAEVIRLRKELVKGEPTPLSRNKIEAECHSDDYTFEIEFDCLSWFEQASDQEITDLIKCGYGGDNPADEVALFYEEDNEEISALMRVCRRSARSDDTRNPIGFECHINEGQAKLWIAINRPHLSQEE